MPSLNNVNLNKNEANSFLSRKLLANSWHRFEEANPGVLERECIEEICSYEEAREVFETDIAGLEKFWASYTGQINTSTELENPVPLILGIVFGVVGFIILLILVYVLWMRRKGELDKKLQENSQPYTPYPILSYYSRRQAGAVENNYESPLLDGLDSDLAMGLSECYVERERLQLGGLITSGNFGEIYQGKLRMRDRSVIDVAVKSLKKLEDPEDVEKFLREGVMMRGLHHDHVLSLIGVCVDSDVENCQTSPLIVLPFMSNGDLRSYLRDGNNVLTVLDLVRFCYQVALGMEYLAHKKVVHRDLAARNCMVDSDGRAKVADFGLSRDLYDRDYYRSNVKTQLPLKWMAPESIRYHTYDEKTDVWSYGIVAWESLTRGAIPYPTLETERILQYLNAGNRMERPACCPTKLYKIMKECWRSDPEDRPTFKELARSTHKLVQDAKNASRKELEETGGGERVEEPVERRDRPNHGHERRKKEEERPKPKPRLSLKMKANERVDKFAENNEKGKDKRRNGRNGATHSRSVASVNASQHDLEVSEYHDAGEPHDTGREISV